MWIAHRVTEDAVATGLVEFAALLVAAAFSVLTLFAVVVSSEDTLGERKMLATVWRLKGFSRCVSPRSVLQAWVRHRHLHLQDRERGGGGGRCDDRGGHCDGFCAGEIVSTRDCLLAWRTYISMAVGAP